LAGSVTVDAEMAGTITAWGDITQPIEITGAMTGYITTLSPGALGASLWIKGDLTGTVSIAGTLDAPLTVDGSVGDTGSVFSGGSAAGPITIGADCAGSIEVGSLVGEPESTRYGHIAINGSLKSDAHITVDAAFGGSTEYITVDWNGWQAGDDWESGAIVTIDQTDYTEAPNNPTDRVWETSCAKGDMDGDGDTNSFDIDPFVMALVDHTLGSDYDLAYPGILGSVEYHGDCDCDGQEEPLFNAFDIDAFVLRIVDPCGYQQAYPGCDPCLDCESRMRFDQAPAPSPADVAALLAESVRPQNYSALLQVAGDLATNLPDLDRAQFWAEVLTNLP
jgi:hypothetical protein